MLIILHYFSNKIFLNSIQSNTTHTSNLYKQNNEKICNDFFLFFWILDANKKNLNVICKYTNKHTQQKNEKHFKIFIFFKKKNYIIGAILKMLINHKTSASFIFFSCHSRKIYWMMLLMMAIYYEKIRWWKRKSFTFNMKWIFFRNISNIVFDENMC